MFDSSKSYCAWVVVTYSSSLDTDDSIGNVCTYAEPSYSWTDTVVVAILATILVAIIDVPISMLFDLLASPTKVVANEIENLIEGTSKTGVGSSARISEKSSANKESETIPAFSTDPDPDSETAQADDSMEVEEVEESPAPLPKFLLKLGTRVLPRFRMYSAWSDLILDPDIVEQRRRLTNSNDLSQLARRVTKRPRQLPEIASKSSLVSSSNTVAMITKNALEYDLAAQRNELQRCLGEKRYSACAPIQRRIEDLERQLVTMPSSTDLRAKVRSLEDDMAELSSQGKYRAAESVRIAVRLLNTQIEEVQRTERTERKYVNAHGGALVFNARLSLMERDMTTSVGVLSASDSGTCHRLIDSWNYFVVSGSSVSGAVEAPEPSPSPANSGQLSRGIVLELARRKKELLAAHEAGEEARYRQLDEGIKELQAELRATVAASSAVKSATRSLKRPQSLVKSHSKCGNNADTHTGSGRFDLAQIAYNKLQKANGPFNIKTFLEELHFVDERVLSYQRKLEVATDTHIGVVIIHEFLADLIGRRGSAAKIFLKKARDEFKATVLVSKSTKLVILLLLLLFNLACLAFVLFVGHGHVPAWQQQFMFACAFQLATETLLFETMIIAWCHIFVPQLAFGEVNNALAVVRGVIAGLGETLSSEQFNTPDYFFVSQALANRHPKFVESLVVNRYRAILPTPSLRKALMRAPRLRSACSTAVWAWRVIYSAPTRCIAAIPLRAQRFLLSVTQPVLYTGLVYLATRGAEDPVFYAPLGAVLFIIFWSIYRVFRRIHDHELLAKDAPPEEPPTLAALPLMIDKDEDEGDASEYQRPGANDSDSDSDSDAGQLRRLEFIAQSPEVVTAALMRVSSGAEKEEQKEQEASEGIPTVPTLGRPAVGQPRARADPMVLAGRASFSAISLPALGGAQPASSMSGAPVSLSAAQSPAFARSGRSFVVAQHHRIDTEKSSMRPVEPNMAVGAGTGVSAPPQFNVTSGPTPTSTLNSPPHVQTDAEAAAKSADVRAKMAAMRAKRQLQKQP